jgi:putative transposase
VRRLVEQRQYSERRTFKLLNLSASVHRYVPKTKNDAEVIEHMMRVVDRNPTWPFDLTYDRKVEEGTTANHKRVRRLYREAKLHLRRRTKRRVPERVKDPIVLPIGPNITWSMDFMADRLLNGNKLRTFNVIDDFGRQALNITIDTSIRAHCVTRELDKLIEWRGKPERLRVDNGPEFIAQEMELWAQRNDIALTYIEKGKPMQNALIESFNRTWREEVLDACLFESLDQLRELTIEFIWSCNHERPHHALMNNTPREFLLKCGQLPAHYTGSRADFPTFQQDDHHKSTEVVIFRNSRTRTGGAYTLQNTAP